MSGHVNVNGEKKKISSILVNVNGEKKKIISAWANKDGVPVKIWDSSSSMLVLISVSSTSSIWYSRDGLSWTLSRDIPSYSDTLEGVVYDPVGDRFVAYGVSYYKNDKGGIVWLSNDGKSWTRKQFLTSSSSFRWTDTQMVVHEGKFYIVTQNSSTGRTYLFVTEDFSTFNQVELFTTTTAYTGETRLPQKMNIIDGKLCFITRNYSCYAPLDQVLDTSAWVYESAFTSDVYMLDKYKYSESEFVLRTLLGATETPYIQHSPGKAEVSEFSITQYSGADISIPSYAEIVGSCEFIGTSYLQNGEEGLLMYVNEGSYSSSTYFGNIYVGKKSYMGQKFDKNIQLEAGYKPVSAIMFKGKTLIGFNGTKHVLRLLDDITADGISFTDIQTFNGIISGFAKKEVS